MAHKSQPKRTPCKRARRKIYDRPPYEMISVGETILYREKDTGVTLELTEGNMIEITHRLDRLRYRTRGAHYKARNAKKPATTTTTTTTATTTTIPTHRGRDYKSQKDKSVQSGDSVVDGVAEELARIDLEDRGEGKSAEGMKEAKDEVANVPYYADVEDNVKDKAKGEL